MSPLIIESGSLSVALSPEETAGGVAGSVITYMPLWLWTMSDTELNPAFIDASDAPIPAENGSREAEYAPPPRERGDRRERRRRRRAHPSPGSPERRGRGYSRSFFESSGAFLNVLVTNEGFRVEAPWS